MKIPVVTPPINRRLLLRAAGALGLGLSGAQLSPLAQAMAQTPVAGDDPSTVAVDAWVYGYPLVTMGLTAQVNTNVASPGADKAPINQFANLRSFPDASFNTVVAPNVDTLYSIAFLELSHEPMVLQWPDMGSRYFLFPILNAWTDVTSFGSRTTGQGGKTLVIAGPDWDGEVPAGIDLPDSTIGLRMPTNLAWILGRIYCSGTQEDYEAVHAIQDQLKLVPLSAWGTDYKAPAGTVNADIDMKSSPLDQVNAMSGEDFFGHMLGMMGANPPYPADTPLLSQLAALGVKSGEPFDASKLESSTQQALQAAPKAGLERLQKDGASTGKKVNGWLFTMGTGDYGTNYLFRAYITLIGLGANLSADAVYPAAFTDSAGEQLSGANKYVIHFDSLPPVKGFWSLTAYNKSGFLIANSLNRYAIRGNDPLHRNPGGSLDLYLQAESPGSDKEANWLPTGDDVFSVYLRMYWPEEAVLNESWKMPTITKAS